MRRLACALAAAALLAGCVNSAAPRALPASQRSVEVKGRSGSTPIQHVVLIVQENRTFNDFFATYPGADGSTTGNVEPNPRCGIKHQKTIDLKERGLLPRLHGKSQDLPHSYNAYNIARDEGAMDGFDLLNFGSGLPECTYPYQYTDPAEITPYWDMARQYTLAEHMFTTQGSSSFTAHQDLIAGDALFAPKESFIDLPSCSGTNCIWGCDAPKGTHTSYITRHNVYHRAQGPFPCVDYPTLRDRLDAEGVTWRYYVPPMCCKVYGKLLSAFDAIKTVRYGSEWTDGHISSPQTNIFTDITNGQLPSVSWVIPDEKDSDHPGLGTDTGPSWVASVVNAIGESSYWNSTAVVIVWDDWGGFYDNLAPPQLDFGGLGFRVPAIIVSPYAKPGYISTTQYEFGSILKYIEDNWGLRSLHRTDDRAVSIADCFDYSQSPIAFQKIGSKYPRSFFVQRKPSNRAPDTDW